MNSIASCTMKGALIGSMIGAGVGLANVPLICGIGSVTNLLLDNFANGKGPSNLDKAFNTFKDCQVHLPLVAATGFGLCGAGVGFLYGIVKAMANPRVDFPPPQN